MRIAIYLIITVILSISQIYSQSEWEKWEAEEVSYQLDKMRERDYSLDNESFGGILLTGIRNLYWFTISDVDGDNCPFHPSCSSFFVKASQKTNIFQGVLMFGDRFTRDSNFYKNPNQYYVRKHRKYFDPVYKHTMNKEKITRYFINNSKN
jgi:putative component of membrane protein insertase Oxa1/YidC/SpoIIIJ protein YidD